MIRTRPGLCPRRYHCHLDFDLAILSLKNCMNENLFLPFPFSSSQVQKYKYFNNTYTHIYIYRMQMLRTMQRPNLALSQRTLQCTNRTQQHFSTFPSGASICLSIAGPLDLIMHIQKLHMSCNLHKGSLYHTVP